MAHLTFINELDDILNTIQNKTGKNESTIAQEVDYARETLNRERKKNKPSKRILGKIKEVYADVLTNVTNSDISATLKVVADSNRTLAESNNVLANTIAQQWQLLNTIISSSELREIPAMPGSSQFLEMIKEIVQTEGLKLSKDADLEKLGKLVYERVQDKR